MTLPDALLDAATRRASLIPPAIGPFHGPKRRRDCMSENTIAVSDATFKTDVLDAEGRSWSISGRSGAARAR